MSQKNILLKLQELSQDNKTRSITSRFYDLYDAIEKTLKNGVTRAAVIKQLHENGFEIKPLTFDTVLKRIRKKRLKELATNQKSTAEINSNHRNSTQEATDEKPTLPQKTPLVGSHNPRDLDKIFTSQPDLDALSKLAKRNRK